MRFNQTNNNSGDVNNAISESGNVVQKTASDNAGANTNSRGTGGSESGEERLRESEQEKAMSIQPGDMVHLKSGGPTMTVESVDNDFGIVKCVWYERKQMFRRNLGFASLVKGSSPLETNPELARHFGEPGMIEDNIPVAIRESLMNFKSEHPSESKAAFIMMRFGRTRSHDEMVESVKSTLATYGIIGLRADDKQYNDDLFSNIQTYIHGCGFGIAIFERIDSDDYNSNVGLEIGYTIALGKKVCLLKDQTMRTLQSDLMGRLYQPFDTRDASNCIPKVLTKWLKDWRFAK
jgi:uncharacterized protein YodC (DUF2158 family)/nucleoside 2-deoxyribosyltransferase